MEATRKGRGVSTTLNLLPKQQWNGEADEEGGLSRKQVSDCFVEKPICFFVMRDKQAEPLLDYLKSLKEKQT